jgi:hypothetical protein
MRAARVRSSRIRARFRGSLRGISESFARLKTVAQFGFNNGVNIVAAGPRGGRVQETEMSLKENVRPARTALRDPRRQRSPETSDVASYALSILQGVRRVTRQSGNKDLTFLDYLLAIAEDEASNLASRIYH